MGVVAAALLDALVSSAKDDVVSNPGVTAFIVTFTLVVSVPVSVTVDKESISDVTFVSAVGSVIGERVDGSPLVSIAVVDMVLETAVVRTDVEEEAADWTDVEVISGVWAASDVIVGAVAMGSVDAPRVVSWIVERLNGFNSVLMRGLDGMVEEDAVVVGCSVSCVLVDSDVDSCRIVVIGTRVDEDSGELAAAEEALAAALADAAVVVCSTWAGVVSCMPVVDCAVDDEGSGVVKGGRDVPTVVVTADKGTLDEAVVVCILVVVDAPWTIVEVSTIDVRELLGNSGEDVSVADGTTVDCAEVVRRSVARLVVLVDEGSGGDDSNVEYMVSGVALLVWKVRVAVEVEGFSVDEVVAVEVDDS